MHVGRVHSTTVPPLLDSVSNALQSALCRWWCSFCGWGSFSFLASSLHSVQDAEQQKERKRKEKATPFGVNLMRSQVLYWAAHDAERYITRGMAEVWTIAFVDATCSVLMTCMLRYRVRASPELGRV